MIEIILVAIYIAGLIGFGFYFRHLGFWRSPDRQMRDGAFICLLIWPILLVLLVIGVISWKIGWPRR